ncbi:DUF397 domain-containing protein [Streptomyces sp. NBC_00989]|uniref:DUF397 domain-containing protein n=1 Tax=Streptomyces sp. NBC_00989 TaxID=2903705 RepID=UPI0038672D61|nr:DUF397 domain-containing protein [Streptomyces sp. NBC_00989]
MGGSWTWHKSSASNPDGAACVEAAWTGEELLVRHSTRPHEAVLAFRPLAWCAFLECVKYPSAARPPTTRRS